MHGKTSDEAKQTIAIKIASWEKKICFYSVRPILIINLMGYNV